MNVVTWEPGYAFTDYPGPWYMSEWFWATCTCVLMLAFLYWGKGPRVARMEHRGRGDADGRMDV